jgi:hypothetical protein
MLFADLLPELQIEILEYLSHDTSRFPPYDYPTLQACSLLCNLWSACAQKMLFKRVGIPKGGPRDGPLRRTNQIPTRRRFLSLLETLSRLMDRRSPLPHCVEEFQVESGIITFREGKHHDERHADLHSVVRAMSLCPELRWVDISCRYTKLSVVGKGTPYEDDIEAQELAKYPFDSDDLPVLCRLSITHLTIAGDTSVVSQLLDVWPQLVYLDLRFSLNTQLMMPTSTLPASLRELRLAGIIHNKFVRWIKSGRQLYIQTLVVTQSYASAIPSSLNSLILSLRHSIRKLCIVPLIRKYLNSGCLGECPLLEPWRKSLSTRTFVRWNSFLCRRR